MINKKIYDSHDFIYLINFNVNIQRYLLDEVKHYDLFFIPVIIRQIDWHLLTLAS